MKYTNYIYNKVEGLFTLSKNKIRNSNFHNLRRKIKHLGNNCLKHVIFFKGEKMILTRVEKEREI